MKSQAVSGWRAEIERRRALLLHYLLLVSVVGGLVALVATYLSWPTSVSVFGRLAQTAPFFVVWLAVLVLLLWGGIGYRVRATSLVLLVYGLGVWGFQRGGLSGSGRVWMLVLVPLAVVLLGPDFGMWIGFASLLAYVVFAIIFGLLGLVPPFTGDTSPISAWIGEGGTFALAVGALTILLWAWGQGWLDALRNTSEANVELQVRTRELERATGQLERRTAQLQATAEIAGAGSSILEPEALLTDVVGRVQEGFSSLGAYYAALFLLDERQEYAALRAATGEAGKLLLEMGHRVALDDDSVVGWCVTHRQARVALHPEGTQLDALPMPHTRSEIVLPLRSRGRILGALSVHSTLGEAFDQDDVFVLQTMADQVAVAFDNARLFSQTETALQEAQAAQRRYLMQAWQEFLAERPVVRAEHTQTGAVDGDSAFVREVRGAAMEYGRTVAMGMVGEADEDAAEDGQGVLVVPLQVRGQVIGTMALHDTRQQRQWAPEEIALAEAVSEQVALTVENLRLMDETQRRAVRERAIREISDMMQRATDMEALLCITAEELNRLLGGTRTYVRLGTEPLPDDGSRQAGEGNGRDVD